MLVASAQASAAADGALDQMSAGFGVFLDWVLEAANAAGLLRVADPPTLVRLLFGAMTRAGLLIASSADPMATRDAVGGSAASPSRCVRWLAMAPRSSGSPYGKYPE